MKLNEALLIGGALLAALVLSKGGAASSNVKAFSGKSAIPVLPIEDKTPMFQIPKIQTFLQKIKLPDLKIFPQFFPVTNTNVQLNQVLDIEKEEKDQRVSYLQDELDQTRSYITTQRLIGDIDQYGKELPLKRYGNTGFLYKSDQQNISNITGKKLYDYTDKDVINYYENFVKSENVTSGLTGQYTKLIARRNVSIGELYADKQQEGINLVEQEYQTRFGGLSRYG